MGGDDAFGRPLGGACVPTPRLLADLHEASEDAELPQSIRKLASDLSSSSAPSYEGIRAVYRALGVAKGIDKAPSLEEALVGKKATAAANEDAETAGPEENSAPSSKDPALAARLQALQDACDQRAYDACVADLTASERRASSRSGRGLSSSLAGSAPAAGLALAASAGTGYAAGFVAARALFPDEVKHPAARFIGGLAGLVAAISVEAGLVVVRAVRAEGEERRRRGRSEGGRALEGPLGPRASRSPPMPEKIARRLTESELAAEAEVAAAVVKGAATAARAGAEGKALEAAREAEKAAARTEDEPKKQR